MGKNFCPDLNPIFQYSNIPDFREWLMQVGYYPGCSLESTAKEFDLSIRAILRSWVFH